MTHDYHWTRTPAEGIAEDNVYTITWLDGETEIVSCQLNIVGTEENVGTALIIAAIQLRENNSSLFPADDPEEPEQEV